MSDFLSWDTDLDLDLLLGEYTEYDPSDSDHSDDFKVSSPKKRKTDENSLALYQCPQCSKKLKTISGFRGHTTKQHGQQLRASDHRINDDPSTKRSTSTFNNSDLPFNSIFEPALFSTLSNIQADPFLVNPEQMSILCTELKNSQQAIAYLKTVFVDIFVQSSTTNISLTTEREQLFRNLHKTRTNTVVLQQFSMFFTTQPQSAVRLFLQLIFEDIVGELILKLTDAEKTSSDKEQSCITDNDQSILFYIAGYIVHSLKKKYTRHSVHKLSLISKFSDNSENHNFVKRYSKWYKIQDRGGLQKPSDIFFLLVRELELVVRKSTPATLTATSFLIEPLVEQIMESFMVKYYGDILMPTEPCDITSAVIEDIVQVFLKIRGYAVTRVERNKLIKSTSTSRKAASSLRQALKEKIVN